MLSKGAKALKRSGKTQAEIAALVGVDRTAVTRWLKGERVPAADARLKLLEKLGIPLDAWSTPTAPSPPAPARSHGAVLLAGLGRTEEELAAVFGVARSSVGAWLRGEYGPSTKQRAAGEALGIPATAWDVPPPRLPPESASQAPPGRGVSLLDDVPAIRDRVQRLMLEVESDPSSTPLERSKVLGSCAATISVLAKATGEFNHGRQLMKLPMWRQIRQAIERALAPYPDAAEALGKELERLGDEVLHGRQAVR